MTDTKTESPTDVRCSAWLGRAVGNALVKPIKIGVQNLGWRHPVIAHAQQRCLIGFVQLLSALLCVFAPYGLKADKLPPGDEWTTQLHRSRQPWRALCINGNAIIRRQNDLRANLGSHGKKLLSRLEAPLKPEPGKAAGNTQRGSDDGGKEIGHRIVALGLGAVLGLLGSALLLRWYVMNMTGMAVGPNDPSSPATVGGKEHDGH